jgi:hypothetical protein
MGEKRVRAFGGKRNHYEDLDVDEKMKLIWILEEWSGSINCIHLAQERDMWLALFST